MNVLVATDGSKYGQWGLNWAASLPFVEPPKVMALHVLDSAWLRGPFRTRPEILRVEARSARTLKKAKQQLAALKLKGTVRKEQGAVAPVILKRAPKRDGLLVVGSQGLDALDRFLLGSVSTKLIQHAAMSGAGGQGRSGTIAADHLGDGWIRRSGHSLGVCVDQVSAESFNRQGRARADACERDPCDSAQPLAQVPGAERGQPQINRPERAEVDQGGIYGRASVSAWEPG